MLEAPLLSVRVRPFTIAELFVVRYLSRLDSDDQAYGRVLTRFRYLRVAMGASLGWRAARGMRRAEAALIFIYASRPARDSAELRLKAGLMRSFLDDEPSGNHASMLEAALECDASRLGLLANPLTLARPTTVAAH